MASLLALDTYMSSANLNRLQLDVLDSFPKIKIAIGYKDPQTGEVLHISVAFDLGAPQQADHDASRSWPRSQQVLSN